MGVILYVPGPMLQSITHSVVLGLLYQIGVLVTPQGPCYQCLPQCTVWRVGYTIRVTIMAGLIDLTPQALCIWVLNNLHAYDNTVYVAPVLYNIMVIELCTRPPLHSSERAYGNISSVALVQQTCSDVEIFGAMIKVRQDAYQACLLG